MEGKEVPSEIENPERFSKVKDSPLRSSRLSLKTCCPRSSIESLLTSSKYWTSLPLSITSKKFQRIEKNRLEEFLPPPADTQWFWIYPCLAIFPQGNNDDAPALEKIPQITVQLLDRLRYELEQEDGDISICLAHLWRAITLRSTPMILRNKLLTSADAAIVGANEVMGGHRKLSKSFLHSANAGEVMSE